MPRKLNLLNLFGIANAVLFLAAAAGVGWDMSGRYVDLV